MPDMNIKRIFYLETHSSSQLLETRAGVDLVIWWYFLQYCFGS